MHLAVLLVRGVSSLVKTLDGCSFAELTVNSTCTQALVLGISAELTAESTCTQPLVALWRVGSARHLLLASFMVSPRKVLALL